MNLVMGLLLAMMAATSARTASIEKTLPAAVEEKTPIFLQVEAHDPAGANYVDLLRAKLEASSAYKAVDRPGAARFIVGIVTMDPNEDNPGAEAGRSTVAAVTLQRENGDGLTHFVYSWVLVARQEKAATLAAELLGAIDKEIRGLDVSASAPRIVFEDEKQ